MGFLVWGVVQGGFWVGRVYALEFWFVGWFLGVGWGGGVCTLGLWEEGEG